MHTSGEQAFYRGSDRIIGGVCSGLATGFRINPLWVRIALVLLAFLQGIGLFIYRVVARDAGADRRAGGAAIRF
jgi:phage shock protein PspC (stress-responsive transcriptional regulator)